MNILADGMKTVEGAREKQYGDPVVMCTRIGRVWGALLGRDDIPADTVAEMMVALKLVRDTNRGRRHPDNLVDAAGYLYITGLVRNGQ